MSAALSLSIVIPCHARTDLLAECLQSVVKYAPLASEVLVVDDASPGGAVGRTAAGFPGVRTLRLPRRRGFCVAANAGLRATRGAVVELLNDDTVVTAGWAEAALACFADPKVGAVAPLVLFWPGEGRPRVDSAGDRYDLGGFARKRGHGERLGPNHLRPRRVFGASGSSAFYRRAALERVGLFPESFGAYFEDVDLSFRLHRAGYAVAYAPASRVLHRGGSSYGRASRRLVERQSCNEERVFWRNLPGPLLRRALARHLAVLGGKALRRWDEGTLLPWLWGRVRAWSELCACRRHSGRLPPRYGNAVTG
jgi:GT2 family glycosyltransferase